jgi:methyl-accepting chemotaxis protein
LKISIGTKLIISFLSVIIVSLVVSISTFYLLNNSRSSAIKLINETNQITTKTTQIKYDMLQMSDGMRGLLLDPKNDFERQRKLDADDDLVKMVDEISKLTDNPGVLNSINKIGEMDEKQLNTVENKVMDLIKIDDAKATKLYWEKYIPLRVIQFQLIEEMESYVIKNRDTTLAQTQEKYNRVLNIAYFMLALLFLMGIGVVTYVSKSISGPISKIIKDADFILKESLNGNLSVRVETEGHQGDFMKIIDGINHILDAVVEPVQEGVKVLQKMSDGDFSGGMTGDYKGDHAILKDSLNNTLKSINELLSHVNATVDQVLTSSELVSSTSQALSQGATEQASSLEELTSSMQEIDVQTRQNAGNANQARQFSAQAKTTAENGNEQMKELMIGISEINGSSKNISKIIKVIDEIAFQTNLLALNAAVEAARAGRQGKGFAVVAEEVRNLASRSSAAAKETSELIENAIKKAENVTVISEKTLTVLKEIEVSSTKVAGIVEEISEACNEQSQGVSQVNTGLEQISQVTQQNTSSSEECASAAEELYSQSEELGVILTKFKLKEEQGVQFSKAKQTYRNGNGSTSKALVLAGRQSRSLKPNEIISLEDFGKY